MPDVIKDARISLFRNKIKYELYDIYDAITRVEEKEFCCAY